MKFEDHFSRQARAYALYRPQYPDALFDYLAEIAPGRRLAWDCGTGSGQAARALVERFERVIATDGSAEQIAQALPHPRITYRIEVAGAGATDAAGSVDLIASAQAAHWFDLDAFYQAARRAARPEGIVALWMYHLPVIAPEIDEILHRFYAETLGGYWPEGFHYLDAFYRTLPFPFTEIEPPAFEMRADWELDHMAGFLDSWSAARRYLAERGQHPIETIWDALSAAWGAETRVVRWPLYMRVGRVKTPLPVSSRHTTTD